MRRLVAFIVAAVILIPLAAQAALVDLALCIDGSGSISSSNFDLQKDAYVSVLNNASVLPRDGSVAVAVYLFSAKVTQVYDLTVIDNTTISGLISAINGMTQTGGLTDIARAIDAARDELLNNPDGRSAADKIIDVSTDGIQTVPGDPAAAATNAIALGIDYVNGLGIGPGANLSWVPTGSNKWMVDSFDDFEDTLEDKIVTETGGVIPEPATLLLLGSGLLGLGGLSFRKRKQKA